MDVRILILNYNGEALLPECLPSILDAAENSKYPCRVTVIDNQSTDESLRVMSETFPETEVLSQPNHGLCSYNGIVAESKESLVFLINNDIQLTPDAIDPLVECFDTETNSGNHSNAETCFFAAPQCYLFDRKTYEGFKTAITWRRGLLSASSHFEKNETVRETPDWTAMCGAALLVDRKKFLELGGFDPIYLPGRIEDLDLCYRAFQAGYHGEYVPISIVYHQGAATFEPAFGQQGCLELAWKNTLIFQWKHLRHPKHILEQSIWIPIRLAWDLCTAMVQPKSARFTFWKAFSTAVKTYWTFPSSTEEQESSQTKEMEFFQRFSVRSLLNPPQTPTILAFPQRPLTETSAPQERVA